MINNAYPVLLKKRRFAAFTKALSLYYHPDVGYFRFANDKGFFKRKIHVFLHDTAGGSRAPHFFESFIPGFYRITPVAAIIDVDRVTASIISVAGGSRHDLAAIVSQLSVIAAAGDHITRKML